MDLSKQPDISLQTFLHHNVILMSVWAFSMYHHANKSGPVLKIF